VCSRIAKVQTGSDADRSGSSMPKLRWSINVSERKIEGTKRSMLSSEPNAQNSARMIQIAVKIVSRKRSILFDSSTTIGSR
jgi:hypothetical protein